MPSGHKWWSNPVKQGEKWRLRQGANGYYTLFVNTNQTVVSVESAIVGVYTFMPTDEEIQRAIVLYRLGVNG